MSSISCPEEYASAICMALMLRFSLVAGTLIKDPRVSFMVTVSVYTLRSGVLVLLRMEYSFDREIANICRMTDTGVPALYVSTISCMVVALVGVIGNSTLGAGI